MHILAVFLIALLFPVLAHALDNPPIPKRKTEALNLYENQLSKESQAKEQLEQKIESVTSDLSSTKKDLINTAAIIQKNERDIKSLETRIANLEIKKSILDDQVKEDRKTIASIINALQKIRRTPTELMLARPDTPYRTAQSAMLMGQIIPSLNRHAEKLNNTFETIDRVARELKNDQAELLAQSHALEERQKNLATLVDKRQNLYSKIDQDIKIREITIQKISMQAKNLEDLVSRIKEEERLEEERRKTAFLIRPKATPPVPEQPEYSGDARMPISGIIRISYDQTDDVGAKSKGITIEGRSASLVVAPMDGKIQFAGAFKRYGNIVIIEHGGGYHSLVAGLDNINVAVGSTVKSGEPIGTLPNSSLNPRPTLYYELRQNGNPVNPAKKFSDLG